MRLSELADEDVTPDPEIAGLTADSRRIAPGFLFAAIPGTEIDGAQFIPQAEKHRAAAVLARPGTESKLPTIYDVSPRKRLSEMASRFYSRQPEIIAGVTGTNGKTSTVFFAAQLWDMLGKKSCSLGTLGARGHNFERPLIHTTPEPVTLHRILNEFAANGFTHLAMEASSHGLAQYRVDHVQFSIAAYTNITQDHLDYHANFEDYIKAKSRLMTDLLTENGIIVINADGAGAESFIEEAKKTKRKIITTGFAGDDVKLLSAERHSSGLLVEISCGPQKWALRLPLIGAFQAENALLAVGIVHASGAPIESIVPLLSELNGVPGRMELAAEESNVAIYVDYAHTPAAIESAVKAIRPHVEGRVIVIVGAGGDRDATKRSAMGQAAADHADIVIVTDDNPRNEDPSKIRSQVMEGCPSAIEIGNRYEAIAKGVNILKKNDVLLITGKGHESGQQVGNTLLPFNDVEEAKRAMLQSAKGAGR